MIVFLNAGSIVLGLAAWIMPVISIIRCRKTAVKMRMLFTVISFTACAFSLFMQIAEIQQRVILQDWAALMDTAGALVKISLVLVVITVVLNGIAWVLPTKQQRS